MGQILCSIMMIAGAVALIFIKKKAEVIDWSPSLVNPQDSKQS